MEYNCRTIGDTFEASLTGRLTFEHQQKFRNMLEEMKKSDAGRWVVDLSKLDFVDSAGMGLLLRVKAASEQKGRQLALRVAPEGSVRKLMELSKFEQLIPIVS